MMEGPMNTSDSVASVLAAPGREVGDGELAALVEQAFPVAHYAGRRVLVIVPDATRSGPVDRVFGALWNAIGPAAAALDVMVALGTHQPMSDDAIRARLGLTAADHAGRFAKLRLFNHAWNDPAALTQIGVISADEINALSGGLFRMEVPVEINRRVLDYDELVIIGPVFPHEVVGFSGGNKYLFPGVAGPRLLNFFHWLGAVVTNPLIIGNADTPVRKVVDRAGAMVPVPKRCLAMVVQGKSMAGLFAGTPESAWRAATPLSAQLHIRFEPRPFHTILSCLPTMYEDLWTGGKGMYKLEPVLADDGELIIYAPHITEVSVTHGKTLLEIGYHCRDYFLAQWERFSHHPWGVIAHSTHVRGAGRFENGVERFRARVTLATGIPREICERISLGYRDPASITPQAFAGREAEGVLLVPRAGETLYRLNGAPTSALSPAA